MIASYSQICLWMRRNKRYSILNNILFYFYSVLQVLRKVKLSAVTQIHTKRLWRSGRVVDCNPEGCGIESRWCYFWWFIRRKVDGKLSENSFAGEQKTIGKFRWFRNIPSSSSELVGLIRSSCQKSFPSPLQVSLLHPVRLAEFSVNFFFSVHTCNYWVGLRYFQLIFIINLVHYL